MDFDNFEELRANIGNLKNIIKENDAFGPQDLDLDLVEKIKKLHQLPSGVKESVVDAIIGSLSVTSGLFTQFYPKALAKRLSENLDFWMTPRGRALAQNISSVLADPKIVVKIAALKKKYHYNDMKPYNKEYIDVELKMRPYAFVWAPMNENFSGVFTPKQIADDYLFSVKDSLEEVFDDGDDEILRSVLKETKPKQTWDGANAFRPMLMGKSSVNDIGKLIFRDQFSKRFDKR